MRRRRSQEVTERDAFGNEIAGPPPLTGGDPLGATPPTARILPAAGTVPLPHPPLRPRPPRRARRRILGGLLGLAVFVGPFLVGGWFAYRAIRDTVDSTTTHLRQLDDRPLRPPAAATPPRGLEGASLLAPRRFDAVLRTARANGGRLTLLRLAPARADLQLLRAGGGLDLLQLRAGGGRSRVRSPTGGTGSKAIILSTIDRHAPARLVRAAAHRLGRRTTSVDYLVLLDVAGGPMWAAYFTGGAAFRADAHGRITGRIQ